MPPVAGCSRASTSPLLDSDPRLNILHVIIHDDPLTRQHQHTGGGGGGASGGDVGGGGGASGGGGGADGHVCCSRARPSSAQPH